jgi:DNA polymerase-4
LDVEAEKQRITGEAGSELVNLSLGDSSVSLLATGYWKGTLGLNWGIALTPFGTQAFSGDSPVLFTQEADLTLSLWIREKWFVEGSFSEDYSLNTYRAGYQGFPGETVQYIGAGNTGLDFPSFPYLDLGGDSPSSFGVYSRFGGGDLSVHGLARYDAAAREERVFSGNRERIYGYADLSRPLRGVSFVLPDENLESIPVVYIQDKNGTYTDEAGRRWRLAEASEYAASARYGLVELSLGTYTGGAEEPPGMIAAAYSASPSGVDDPNKPWNTSLGEYGTADLANPGAGDGSGYLGEAQYHFDLSGREIALKDYPQSGGGAEKPGAVKINGVDALVIYEPGTFSPFERQNRYSSQWGSSAEAALVRLSSGERVKGFEVLPLEDASALLPGEEGSSARRGLYELARDGASPSGREAGGRWPLAGATGTEAWPELYLPGKQVFTGDIGIEFTSYGTPDVFFIGSDAVPGSVQVFRSGIADPHFSYSPSTGIVSLSNPPGFNEVIRITYLKRSDERQAGSFAAGLGAFWDPEGPFSSRIGLGLRWNVKDDSYSEAGIASPGTVGIGAEGRWDYDSLKAALTLGLGFEQPDTTGLYRVAGMEGNEIVLSLPPGNSFISEPPPGFTTGNRADLVYRNYREISVMGTASLTDIESGAGEVSGESGPYPAMDRNFSTQILAAEFKLTGEKYWTGFETALGLDGAILERAKEIVVPFRLYGFSNDSKTDKLTVTFQAGSLSDKGSGSPENPELIIEKPLFGGSDTYDTKPRFKSFNLDDEDRRKLQNAAYMRILVSATGLGSGETVSGRVLLAPPVVKGAGFRPVRIDGDRVEPAEDSGIVPPVPSVAVREHTDTKLESKYGDMISRLHSGGSRQRVLELQWENFDAPPLEGTGAGADARLGTVPLSNYRSLQFFMRWPKAVRLPGMSDTDLEIKQTQLDKARLRFFLGSGPQSPGRSGETALDAIIPFSDFSASPGEWVKVVIRYRGDDTGVFIDGKKAGASSSLTYHPEVWGAQSSPDPAGTKPAYAAFFILPESPSSSLPDGKTGFDEILLEDAVPSYRLNTGGSVEWSVPGTIASIRGRPVISDIFLQAALETGAQGNPFDQGPGLFGMNGSSRGEASVLGARLSLNYSYALSTGNGESGAGREFSWRAGHGFSRSWGPFSVSETFNDSPGDKAMDHRVSLDFNSVFRSSLSGEVSYQDERLRRKWNAGIGVKPREFPLNVSADAGAEWAGNSGGSGENLKNYGQAWIDSWEPLVPDRGAGASRRDSKGSFTAALETLPLGVRLTLESSAGFTGANKTTQAVSLGRLDLPWVPEFRDRQYRFLFKGEREFRRSLFYESRDFRDDAERYGESVKDSLPLMFSLPFYSLGNPVLGDSLVKANSDYSFSESPAPGSDYRDPSLVYSRFSDRFETTLQMPADYGLSSFFIPSLISARIGRTLEQKMDTPLDTLSLGGGLKFQAVNMFGAFGAAPVFSFYQSDEFSHSIEGTASFPKGEKTSWTIRGGQAASFHGFAGAELSLDNAFTVNSSSSVSRKTRWTESLSIKWTVPAEKTLLSFIYDRVVGLANRQNSWLTLAGIAGSEYERLRIETLEFSYEHDPGSGANDSLTRFSIILGHESAVRISGRLNLSAFAKLSCSEDFSTRVLSFLAALGTSLSVTF